MSIIYGTSWAINTIDKYEHTFYTYYQVNKRKPIQNHTNGVGAPLIRIGFLLHTHKFNAETARI